MRAARATGHLSRVPLAAQRRAPQAGLPAGRCAHGMGWLARGGQRLRTSACDVLPILNLPLCRSVNASPLGWSISMGLDILLVVACALIDADGRVLLAKRPPGRPLAGLWEFPGGKVEPGETPDAALIRELEEELAIRVTPKCLAPFTFASHSYEAFHLLMP